MMDVFIINVIWLRAFTFGISKLELKSACQTDYFPNILYKNSFLSECARPQTVALLWCLKNIMKFNKNESVFKSMFLATGTDGCDSAFIFFIDKKHSRLWFIGKEHNRAFIFGYRAAVTLHIRISKNLKFAETKSNWYSMKKILSFAIAATFFFFLFLQINTTNPIPTANTVLN